MAEGMEGAFWNQARRNEKRKKKRRGKNLPRGEIRAVPEGPRNPNSPTGPGCRCDRKKNERKKASKKKKK